ncbi:hypothetical protein BDD12DRAFT_929670 [Trichophaea hybrida]|nr:hypothetical protein BDD12DRAFT_929670 [Trichophaea hybrida]
MEELDCSGLTMLTKTKLSGSDSYSSWATEVETLLRLLGHWRYVTSEVEPGRHGLRITCAFTCSTLEPWIRYRCQREDNPKELWEFIKEYFRPPAATPAPAPIAVLAPATESTTVRKNPGTKGHTVEAEDRHSGIDLDDKMEPAPAPAPTFTATASSSPVVMNQDSIG